MAYITRVIRKGKKSTRVLLNTGEEMVVSSTDEDLLNKKVGTEESDVEIVRIRPLCSGDTKPERLYPEDI